MSNEATTILSSYFSFKLGNELFAVHVSKVLEILEMTKITEVPKMPPYMKGVINLRGSVLPLIDARIKFGLAAIDTTVDSCIVVLDIEINGESVKVGALVDAVQEVLEVEEEQIQPAPSIGSKYRSEFIDGMLKVDDRFLMLLNIDKIFSVDDLVTIRETSKTKAEEKKPNAQKIIPKRQEAKKAAIKSSRSKPKIKKADPASTKAGTASTKTDPASTKTD